MPPYPGARRRGTLAAVMFPRAAVLATLIACAPAPRPTAPINNVADPTETARPLPPPRCPPSTPARVPPPAPALGGIAGTVVDAQCEILTGATIVVRSNVRLTRAEITDERGRFAVLDLPPGEYVVAVYYLDSTLERGGVQIRAGAVEHVQLSMPPPVKAEPRITRTLAAP
jgi:hypothetical protein